MTCESFYEGGQLDFLFPASGPQPKECHRVLGKITHSASSLQIRISLASTWDFFLNLYIHTYICVYTHTYVCIYKWIFSLFTFEMFSPSQVSSSETPSHHPSHCLCEGAPPPHSCLPTLAFPYTGASNSLRPKALSFH